MSLYNALCGQDPSSAELLSMIGRSENDFGRFRDIRLKDAYTIVVLTGDGGDNRQCCQDTDSDVDDDDDQSKSRMPCICSGCVMTHCVPSYPHYLRDKNCSFDGTYAKIYFSVPLEHRERTSNLILARMERERT